EARFGEGRHVLLDRLGLALRELEALLVCAFLVREGLDEERDVIRGAFGTDALDHDLLAKVEVSVIEWVVVDEDLDAVRAGLDQAPDRPPIENVGHAVLRIRVVAGPLVREEDARVRRLRFERWQTVF